MNPIDRPVCRTAWRSSTQRALGWAALVLINPLIGLWGLALLGAESASDASVAGRSANSVTYLDGADPFYVGKDFPKLITPEWIGEPGVDAVVVLAIDDMTESGRYETFLRPILDRLKSIDGRAPVSIMTRSVPADDPQVQRWLREGVSLEAHTISHPCPLLAKGDFQNAATNYYDCLDALNEIAGNKPVAFRMPCCDSMNSTSPRFFTELFNRVSPKGNFLAIDSSVMDLLTTNDSSLPQPLVLARDGRERFRKYFPAGTNAVTRLSLENFATTIEDYPYPYVVNRLGWEFPCVVPSDFEASNFHGPTNQVTLSDWQAALDAIVLKRGVFTLIFHPYNWIRNDQIVALIDYAASKYGSRIKFLNFREALARLNHNLLLDQPLRGADGGDNGDRLLDLNGDGFVDAILASLTNQVTRVWNPATGSWSQSAFPMPLVSGINGPRSPEVKFGLFGAAREPIAFFRDRDSRGAWVFHERGWKPVTNFFNGLTFKGSPVLTSEGGRDRGVRLRDIDNDGQCELLVGNENQNAAFKWSEAEGSWNRLPFGFPEGVSIVGASGEDTGLRFIDLNGDGYDDLLISNQEGYAAYLFIAHAKTWLGWEVGWSYKTRAGRRGQTGEIPMIVRGGEHSNNGAWFHDRQLFVQNEDTSSLPDKVARVSFQDLQLGEEPPPKSPQEAIDSFVLEPGLTIELVASEPEVVDPVAFDWAPNGRLWVVEMRDYPLGMDGKGKPGGVVRVLEDTHGNGHYDKSTVFMEGIGFPNGIMCWGKGVLISAAPDIFYAEDTNGDDRADVRRLLYTGFKEGNQQHRVNGFEYGLDNWVYAANGGSGGIVRSVQRNEQLNLRGHDLRMRPEEDLMELQPGASQFGRHRDDWGDWFGNDNSRWLWHYFAPEHYLARNPRLSVGSLTRFLPDYPNSSRVFSVSHPQQRFNWPNALFEVTSACSPAPYRDELFGPEFEGSVLICEPANNVIHREVLQSDGVTFHSHRAAADSHSEFLASRDNWCRPVTIKTGPDGALYFADMYRLVIEHPEYFPDELKHRPDLRAGEDKGRIYRIYPAGAKLRPIPRLDGLSTLELVAAMDSPNGWQRDTIQRLLVQGHQAEAAPALARLAQHCANPKARLQALCTLSGLNALNPSILLSALGDSHWAVRRQAVALCESLLGQKSELDSAFLGLQADPDLRVRYQLAFSLGECKTTEAGRALGRLMLKDWSNEQMRLALMSSAPAHLAEVVREVFDRTPASALEPTLVERLVELATRLELDGLLAEMLSKALAPQATRYELWQMSAIAGLAAALDARNLTLTEYERQSNPAVQRALGRVPTMLAQAGLLAADSQADGSARTTAIRLLARTTDPRPDIERLGSLLAPQNSPEIQDAALARLQRLGNQDVARVLLQAWRRCALTQRQAILNTLFSRAEWADAVLSALESGKLQPAELGPLGQQKLVNHQDPRVRERASRLWSAADADRRKIVASYQSVTQLEGNRTRGHELFLKNCAICHRLQGEGQSIGPDLGTMADKPVSELIVAILDPNQAVDPAYTAYTAVTMDDREFSGILASETATSITLRLAGGAEEQIPRSDLRQFTSSGRSLMPEGFESALRPQDLADVIAFVQNPSK